MGDCIYNEFGGIRKGQNFLFALKATWPLAKLEIFREKIVLKYLFFGKIEFQREEIDRIEPFRTIMGPLGRGIRIFHHKDSVSPFIVFWSFSLDTLLNNLKKAKYID